MLWKKKANKKEIISGVLDEEIKNEAKFKNKILKDLETKGFEIEYREVEDFNKKWGEQELEYLRNTIPDILKLCRENNIWRQIIIDYYNVNNGSNVTTYVSDFIVKPIDFMFDFEVFDCTNKLVDCKNIAHYITTLGYSLDNTFDFFFCSQEENSYICSNEFTIDNIEFDEHYFDTYNKIIKEFKKDKEFMSNGVKVNSCPAVGREEVYLACDPDLLLENIKTAFIYLKEARKSMLMNGINIKPILQCVYFETNDFDFIFKNEELFTNLIAYNSEAASKIDEIPHSFDTKTILLNAININPRCYGTFPDKYKSDNDIITLLLSKDMLYIRLVYREGVTDKDDFNKYILNYFK